MTRTPPASTTISGEHDQLRETSLLIAANTAKSPTATVSISAADDHDGTTLVPLEGW